MGEVGTKISAVRKKIGWQEAVKKSINAPRSGVQRLAAGQRSGRLKAVNDSAPLRGSGLQPGHVTVSRNERLITLNL
jgi:hypothetical protein